MYNIMKSKLRLDVIDYLTTKKSKINSRTDSESSFEERKKMYNEAYSKSNVDFIRRVRS
jgi:hypothetical protein